MLLLYVFSEIGFGLFLIACNVFKNSFCDLKPAIVVQRSETVRKQEFNCELKISLRSYFFATF